MTLRPLDSPKPDYENVTAHPSSASLPAIKQNTKVTNVWGLLGLLASMIVPPTVVKLYSDHQDATAQQVAEKQIMLKQQVDDMKQADKEAHERIEKHVADIEDKQERNHAELMQALKKR